MFDNEKLKSKHRSSIYFFCAVAKIILKKLKGIMKYMGSKNRIANEIIPIMLKERKQNQWFVDMFCGGCHIIQNVDGRRIANDKNKYLIAMWKGLQENRERPKTISKELYSKARTEYNNGTNIEFDDFMIGWKMSCLAITPNVPSIAAVAELELQNFKLRTNVK